MASYFFAIVLQKYAKNFTLQKFLAYFYICPFAPHASQLLTLWCYDIIYHQSGE